jgi:hypothetical protein
MSVEVNSIHYNPYYKQCLDGIKTDGILGKVYDIITDLTNRRGLRQEWEQLDGVIQDHIISDWVNILSKNKPTNILVDELILNLCNYNGIGDQWNMIDDDIQKEIMNIWKEILKNDEK